MKSKLTKNQKIVSEVRSISDGETMVVTLRYDDACGNGHNSFGITADIKENGRFVSCGCNHDEIVKHFPEYAHFIRWHLMSSKEPMHYIANTMYHASNKDFAGTDKAPDLKAARNCAIWHGAELSDFTEAKLKKRLPELRKAFKSSIEEMGFVF